MVRSGEDFGRLALQARVDGTKYVGNGIYDDSHRFITALETRYAILRSVALLGEIGYENQEYSGTSPFSISDAIWSVGLRLTPGPDSIVVIKYGRQNGFNSFYLNAGTALGGRTNLFATYRETLATTLTQAQDLLATTTVDALGNPVDSQSGAPVVLINPFLGLSDALYRIRVGTVSLATNGRAMSSRFPAWQSQEPITLPITPCPAHPVSLCDFELGARLRRAPPGWRRRSMGTSTGYRLRATRLRATRPGRLGYLCSGGDADAPAERQAHRQHAGRLTSNTLR